MMMADVRLVAAKVDPGSNNRINDVFDRYGDAPKRQNRIPYYFSRIKLVFFFDFSFRNMCISIYDDEFVFLCVGVGL